MGWLEGLMDLLRILYELFLRSPFSSWIQAGLVIGVSILIAKMLIRVLDEASRRVGLEVGVRKTIGMIVQFIIYVAAFFIAFKLLGVDISGLLTAAGLVSMALAFATGQLITNLVSGLFILSEKPFEKGDVIQVGGDVGRVVKVGVRTTTIITSDGRTITIPNQQLALGSLINYARAKAYRVSLPFNIKKGRGYEDVRRIVEDVLKDYAKPNHPKPEVLLKNVTSTLYSFIIQVWTEDPLNMDKLSANLLEKLREKFEEAGVEFA